MRLRFAGTCRVCGVALPERIEAVYERTTKTVRCLDHSESECPPVRTAIPSLPEVGVGTAGASARREFERRHRAREDRVRAKHPKLGGVLLALGEDPQSTKAWDTGAIGEERLGARLNQLSSDSLLVLHDRRIPGTRANIDHLAVAPSGIWVIDAKKYAGRPQLRVEGGIVRARTEKLIVGTRDCTKLVEGMHKQIGVVHRYVDDDVPVHGVLCFVEADWPLIGGAFSTRGVRVVWPKKLYPQLQADGGLDQAAIASLHRQLATALPQA
jgi:hypothetical protein